MNCAQALVQIVYWWHPLLWFANARIRRVREEAVDDAVMLALRDDAEAYAPTLLEVAKLAFHRPLASLGLVGILESRSALRQRIERLVNFRAPRKAGLTLVSLCGICVFSAIALPMGKAAVSAGNQPVSQVDASDQNLTVKVNPEVFIKNVKAEAATYMHAPTDDYTDILLDILRGEGVDCVPPHGLAFNTKTGEITTQNTPEALEIFRQVIEQLNRPDGKCALPMGFSTFHRKSVVITGQFYKMRTADFDNLVQGLDTHNNKHGGVPWWSVSPDHFNSFNEHVKSLGLSPFQRPRVQTSHGVPAQLYCGTETNGIDLSCLPSVTVDGTNGAVDLAVRVNTKGWFTDNPAGDWPTFVGTNSYAISARAWAEDHGGIVLRVENPSSSEVNNLVVVLGVQIVTNNPPPVKTSERLEAIVDRAHKDTAADLGKTRAVPETSRNASPQVFSGITNKPASSADVSTNLDTRTFMVNLNSGLANLRKKTGLAESSTSDEYLRGFSKLLAASGTTLPPTSIWLKENGLLLVRGTPQELDAVGQTVSELNGYLPKEISDKTNVDVNISSGNPVQDARLDYEMGKFDEAESLLTSVLAREPENQAAHYYLNLAKQARYDREAHRHTIDTQGREMPVEKAWEKPVNRGLLPTTNPYATTNIVHTGDGREVIYSKLNRIRFDKVSWPEGLPLSEVLRNLNDQTKLRDPDKKGINFTFHPNAPAASAATASAGSGEAVDAGSINVKLTLTDMRLADVLDAIVLAADHPIKYSVLDYGIVFSAKGSDSPPLETRTFNVNPKLFLAALQKQTGLQTNVSAAMKQLLSIVGVELSPPKSIYYNENRGVLFVHATPQDLDTIEKAVQALITPPSQIHIKARFIEVPEDLAKYQLGTNLIPAGVTSAAGILTDPNFRLVLHTLEQSKGTETLAEPEATTVSDRQTQMRATEIISVINGINPQARRSPGVSATNVMQIMQIETGPVLDVIPHLMGDGCTLDLNVTAGVTEFTGYDERGKTNIAIVYVDGRKQQVNIPIPQITTRELKTNLRVRDGQTILLCGVSHETLVQHTVQVPGAGSRPTVESHLREQTTRIVKKQLLVLITATLVDPAGNRIHGDDEMSPARTGIPPQDSP